MDPVDDAGELRPARRHESGPAGAEVTTECITGIAHMPVFDEEAREMAAADRGRWTGVARSTWQAAGDAQCIELSCDACGAFATRMPDRRQSVGKSGGVRIDVQANDMYGVIIPHGRDFDPGNQPDAECGRHRRGFGKAAGFVVIGQREQVHAS